MEMKDSAPAITIEDIQQAELFMGVTLPEELKAIYMKNNGGHSICNLFELNKNGYKVNEFLTIKYGSDTIEETYKDVFLENVDMPSQLVPFASDAGGDYFCIDIAKETYGRVVFFESEYYENLSRAMIELAGSFSEFISKLKIDV